MIVFSDGDPGGPSDQLMNRMRTDKITHRHRANRGPCRAGDYDRDRRQGRRAVYNITNPAQLPQIFLKETAVILKTAIYEEPFAPQQRSSSELLAGFGADSYPLLGYGRPAKNPVPRHHC